MKIGGPAKTDIPRKTGGHNNDLVNAVFRC